MPGAGLCDYSDRTERPSHSHRCSPIHLRPRRDARYGGTGFDVVYPEENKRLPGEILGLGGRIVSEMPLGTFPAPQTISGPSPGALMVEASANFGTSVTAKYAAEPESGSLCRAREGHGKELMDA